MDTSRLKQLFDQNLNQTQIAAAMGVGVSTVNKYLRQLGLRTGYRHMTLVASQEGIGDDIEINRVPPKRTFTLQQFAPVTKPQQLQTSVEDLLQQEPRGLLELIEALDLPPSQVRQKLAQVDNLSQNENGKYFIAVPIVEDELYEEIETVRSDSEQKQFEKRYKALLKELARTQELLNAKAQLNQPHRPINPPPDSHKGEATAVIIGSDWHCGAIVRPNTVNFLNEFTVDIYKERAENFFINSIKLVNKERRDVGINHIVFGLIGDLIENSLHDELIEEQDTSPLQQMQIAEASIKSGLDYWLTTDIEHLTVVTAPGNHGRLTDKMRAATNFKNSLEQLIYQSLAAHYKDNPRIQFKISDGYFNYYSIYDETIAFHHGDAIKSGGGVGGISIPLRKFLYRAQSQGRFTMSVNGHFHQQRIEDDFMLNGSLVGPTAYGMKFGFAPERPQQIFRLLDKEHHWTGYFPILVERRDRS